ncbi:MAG: HAMP domain-containing sensor histidine kinase [Myxococcales bacterium]|nr:HAMP domain-containing sensor histidine kinase [Myxococcales bacterium]
MLTRDLGKRVGGLIAVGLLLQLVLTRPSGAPAWAFGSVLCVIGLVAAWVLVRRALSPLSGFAAHLREMVEQREWERSLRAPALLAAEGGLEDLDALRRGILERIESSQRVRRKAQEASAYKTGFLRSVRHELRTPLNSILGFSDILLGDLDGPLTASQRENLSVIRSSGQRLADLFDEVIDLATMASGEVELEREPADASELMEALADSMEDARAGRLVHVRRELDDGLPPLSVDVVRLRQMLGGLASHALEVTRGPELVLSAALCADGVRLTVRDPSRKLDDRELQSLIALDAEPLKRKGVDQGARLRLHLCRQLAELHGGSLDVYSDPEQGTRFQVVLPTGALA